MRMPTPDMPQPEVTGFHFCDAKMIVEQEYPIVLNGTFAGIAGVEHALFYPVGMEGRSPPVYLYDRLNEPLDRRPVTA